MTVYVALFRGINVGGRNKLPMAELRDVLTDLGLESVGTYIASGNAVFESDDDALDIAERIEATLPAKFALDSSLIRVLVLTADQVRAVVDQAPTGFGKDREKYRFDVVYLLDISSEEALEKTPTNPEVDTAWAGPGALYYRRLSALATKSRLGRVVGTPIYANMTIRNWNTATKLVELVDGLKKNGLD
ncbi:DUF1697 domain-containing protein [Smaragdicoccus niigatensis]|uniref:DUF1697 domain-containing protein n=1 Tax=Smaragdicoccus niigatensis TaxID=359359 RepID=UPI00037D97E9|nr:DUF1697 domain-containing protein [Smaragdicoccus niigatensis]